MQEKGSQTHSFVSAPPPPPLHTAPPTRSIPGTPRAPARPHAGASLDLPEKSHLLVFLLILADDLGGGDAHLHTIHHKPAGPFQGLIVQF